jgi:hypothetical protein
MNESPRSRPTKSAHAVPRFKPAILDRCRHDGWTPERQRAFIAALAASGVVAQAAKAVGMGVTSAYNLRRREGAESFARAWDKAECAARDRALAFVIDQAMNGVTRPRFYRGKCVGSVHTHETRMALAALRAFEAAERAK